MFRGCIVLAAFCLALAASAPVYAEPFGGAVLDSETLEPIAGATLTITGVGQVKTNGAGSFIFQNVSTGELEVKISAPGYDDSIEVVSVSQGGLMDQIFVLLREGIVGETIEIEAIERAPEAPGKQQLTREELQRIPGTRGDALQSIKALPGVAGADGAGAGPGLLVIRGSAPEDSVFLLDGIEIPLVYHFFGLQSILPSEFIETIDFAPGGFGAEKGRATGGVIEINTRDKQITEWNGFAELSFINLAGLVQGPVWKEKNLQATAAIRRSTIDLILPVVIPEDSSLSFTTAPQYYDGQLRIDWLPKSNHRVSMLALGSLDLFKLLLDDLPDPNEPLLTGNFENQTDFTRAITTWAYTAEKVTNRAVVSVGTSGFRFELGPERFLRLSNRRLELRDDFAYQPSKLLQLRAGVEGRLSSGRLESKLPLPPGEGGNENANFSTRPVIERDEGYDNHMGAAYLAADFDPAPGLTITPGVRLDYYERLEKGTVAPRISLRYRRPEGKWTARLAFGHYTRPLQQAEAFQTNLEPEAATQAVLGGEYKLGGGFEASGSVFYTDRAKLTVLDEARNAMDPANAYASRGIGRSYGLEALLRTRRDNLFGWIAYTLSRSDRVDSPLADRRLFDFDQTHNFLIVTSYKYGRWDFSGRWQLVTGVPTTPIIGGVYIADANIYVPVEGEVNSERFPTAHQLDVRIDRSWQFEHIKLSAYLDVTNVYANPKALAYSYNFNFTKREAIEELPLLPALGIRGTF